MRVLGPSLAVLVGALASVAWALPSVSPSASSGPRVRSRPARAPARPRASRPRAPRAPSRPRPPRAPAGWSSPFRLAPGVGLDILPAAIAFSPAGAAAITFGVRDVDAPGRSSAFAILRSPSGSLSGPRRVPGAQEILDPAFDGESTRLLTGTSPATEACCDSAWVVPFPSTSTRVSGRARPLVDHLTGGPAVGRLLALNGRRMLAALATDQGVWVAQSGGAGRFGPARRLTGSGARPGALAATELRGGRSVVAWIEGSGGLEGIGPRSILTASGSRSRAPHSPVTDVTVASGHRIDELGLVPGARAPALGWIESWYASGRYNSVVVAADLTRRAPSRTFALAGELASGLSLAADSGGDRTQVLAWKGCTSTGECSVRASLRPPRGGFARPIRLGAIDASQSPTATVAPNGETLLGWISGGRVLVADRRAGAARFGAPRVVSGSRASSASDLALAFGPARQAIAAWTEGILGPTVEGAVYRAG
ncbi:MAG: hypothetical protein ACR2IP_06465 [Solirubrobacteraceae bacterium]